jgi:uncharacterized protein with HEPN domain
VSRRYRLYLEDLLEAISKIKRYTANLNKADFLANNLVLDACYHNFLVIGEAVKQLPEELRIQHRQVPWKAIAGLRDMLAHEYFRVDNEILWDVVENHLTTLQQAAQDLLTAQQN